MKGPGYYISEILNNSLNAIVAPVALLTGERVWPPSYCSLGHKLTPEERAQLTIEDKVVIARREYFAGVPNHESQLNYWDRDEVRQYHEDHPIEWSPADCGYGLDID
jgi:hypothetical protein